jgi:hypothetical protein
MFKLCDLQAVWNMGQASGYKILMRAAPKFVQICYKQKIRYINIKCKKTASSMCNRFHVLI